MRNWIRRAGTMVTLAMSAACVAGESADTVGEASRDEALFGCGLQTMNAQPGHCEVTGTNLVQASQLGSVADPKCDDAECYEDLSCYNAHNCNSAPRCFRASSCDTTLFDLDFKTPGFWYQYTIYSRQPGMVDTRGWFDVGSDPTFRFAACRPVMGEPTWAAPTQVSDGSVAYQYPYRCFESGGIVFMGAEIAFIVGAGYLVIHGLHAVAAGFTQAAPEVAATNPYLVGASPEKVAAYNQMVNAVEVTVSQEGIAVRAVGETTKLGLQQLSPEKLLSVYKWALQSIEADVSLSGSARFMSAHYLRFTLKAVAEAAGFTLSISALPTLASGKYRCPD